MNTPSGKASHLKRILVVDDEHDLVHLIVRILSRAGYIPIGVFSSEEALALFVHDGDFAVVLTDLVMPGGDGLYLTGRIREICPYVPVILVTGTGHQLTDHEARAHGVNKILRKPFLPEELREVVESVLSNGTPRTKP